MRLIAFVLAAGFVSAVVADEPKNPFRDGSGKATPDKPLAAPQAPVKPLAASQPPAKPDPIKQAPRVIRAAEMGVGQLVPDVAFTDLKGKPGKLSDFKSSKLLVIAMTDPGCPLCKKYAPTLAAIEKEYAAKGVAFLFASQGADKPGDVPFKGRVVHDKSDDIACLIGAKTTTEVFVLDSSRTLLYRGAVDDQYGLGYATDAPKNKYLKAALDEALAGKVPVIGATTAPGCELAHDALPPLVPITYHSRIERIVQQNCVECHHAGGPAPFALETYEQVVAKKAAIKRAAIADQTMPPWFAAPPAKGEHSLWSNDRSLVLEDRVALKEWIDGDSKKGDPADAPLPRKFEWGWLIGKPDAVFQLPKPIAIKATGTMPYQVVQVDTNIDEDRWVQSLEVQPTAREVVHHVLVFAVPKGSPRGAAEAQGFFAAYVPGNNTLIYPEGYAKKLPKNSTIVFQIHYTPNGKATEDQTRFGMIFTDHAPRHEVKVAAIANNRFEIPAGADNHKVEARIPVPWNARVLAFFPHAHLRGKAARYDVRLPDGTNKNLLEVPHYDFNWQLMYRFAEPVSLPRGSVITYTAWYDNSEKNPANPDPKKAIKWGPQTYEEMHLGYLEYVVE